MKPSAQIRAYSVECVFELLNGIDQELTLVYLVEIRKHNDLYKTDPEPKNRTMTGGNGLTKLYEENDSKSSEQNYTRNYTFVCLLAMGRF
jgi:hypothetical protein